ncbi:hypothetical protein NXS98_07375 [Fontisphaera persica]|nr:hypothetical protein [Fontisphaera persica]WCJ60930.1 hypothetical protein NXS98_07375 [Fontisphaera persica]
MSKPPLSPSKISTKARSQTNGTALFCRRTSSAASSRRSSAFFVAFGPPLFFEFEAFLRGFPSADVRKFTLFGRGFNLAGEGSDGFFKATFFVGEDVTEEGEFLSFELGFVECGIALKNRSFCL